ncbi:DUF3857 domain-containing protein [Hymenobacter aerilatus]|uniref:DUF3857 domain-containing protein n=1 Tax=Hymenobacter aerilatus TaxID=2932251 RepID=A0A8T9SW61_9BACT|nr:DUF3857 domain-containing protein [Hymenobacter aerilatus]UOR03989.1 DUF3857 domain-containing protein [Hymenobacter aerilatus]
MQKLLPHVFLLALAGGLSFTANAQTEPVKFGKLDPQDMDAKNFVADSAAEAVVLCDYGQSRFNVSNGEFKIVFERVTRIKILKKSAYDRATVEVPLYHKGTNEEKLSGLRGFTYNMVNGQLVKEKLASENTFREEKSANVTVRKFTLPNVRVGSVIEYAYTVNSDFLFNFQDWQFQESIPVRWSEYRASIPEYFDYKMLMQGYEPLAISEHPTGQTQYTINTSGSFDDYGNRQSASSQTVSANVTNHRWVMKNVPAFRNEPYMTTSRDFVARIDFELAGTKWPNQGYHSVANSWNKINEELLTEESFGNQAKHASFLKEEIAALKAKHAGNPAALTAAVRHLVHHSVKYNDQDRLYATTTTRRAYDQHNGSAADVNLLLIGALRDAGLTAHPVILSTRDHGRVNTMFPLLSNFNYVIAHVALPDNKEMLVDATEEAMPCGNLPGRCLNGVGRLLLPDATQSRWVDLTPSTRFVDYRKVQLQLDEKGGYTGQVHQEYGGYLGAHHRSRLVKLGEKKFMEELAKGHEGWDIPKYAFKEKETYTAPLALDYELTSTGNEQAADMLYINPMRHFGDSKNPFLHEDRRFPVDFGALMDETNLVTLTLPAGYAVEEMPKPLVVDLPDNGGRFMYSISPSENSLQIMTRMNLRKTVYSAEEYAALRDFYSRLLAKQAEQIVLKKKS